MKLKHAVAALVATGAPALAMPASAQIYINVGFSGVSVDDFELGAATGRVGFNFGEYFAIEGEGSFGIIEDDGPESGTGVELENDLGAYGVAKLPLAPNLFAFGRAGYAASETTHLEGDGFAFGFGGQYNFGNSGLRAEWTRRDYDQDPVDSWTISYAYTF
jgi:hypothetical protein